MTATKWIVTSRTNLQRKYNAGFSTITQLLQDLIRADESRNIHTGVLFIDDAASAAAAGIPPAGGSDPQQCKAAVDALYAQHQPDYLVILGAQDVFPFQQIVNPAEDDDKLVPSDLPYACDAPYGTAISAFTGPTRVVGRIPDVPGLGDPQYLQKVIGCIIDFRPLQESDYRQYFAVSTDAWRKSTQQSLQHIFGQYSGLLLSPPAAPAAGYAGAQIGLKVHFLNCHGALGDTRFYGQRGGQYPVALNAANLAGKVSSNTIVAAECCYGAELIDPADSADGRTMSIANAYLGGSALGFLGSSTIAYGPAEGQGLADLITQYFVIGARSSGTSLGRAFLEARQKFLTVSGPQLDPLELKTLAQFYLLGDPSLTLIAAPPSVALSKGVGNTLRNRRKNLVMKGAGLADTMAAAVKIGPGSTARSAGAAFSEYRRAAQDADAVFPEGGPDKEREISETLRLTGFEDAVETIYVVPQPAVAAKSLRARIPGGQTGFRTFMKREKVQLDGEGAQQGAVINRDAVLVIKEDETSVLRWRVYVAR